MVPKQMSGGRSSLLTLVWRDESGRAKEKDSSVQIKEGTIYINAESIIFKPGAFMFYADQQNQDSSASQE